jgi:hypothetical protein
MSARGFVELSERYGTHYRTVAQVACRECGVTSSIGIKSSGGLIPPDQIRKKFEQKGWSIGANPKWDCCPECTRKQKAVILKVVNSAAKEFDSKPREMSRDDRRVIFAKLDEVYLDEQRGYERGWSDNKVATDLGVPRKWVEVIRSENFGALGANEDMSEYLTQAESLLKDARAALDEARKAREAVEAILRNPAFLTLNNISDRISKVDRLAAEVRKVVMVA